MTPLQVLHLCRGREWRGGERQVRLLVQTLAKHTGILQCTATGRGSCLHRALDAAGAAVLPLPWAQAYDPRALLGLLLAVHRLHRVHPRALLLHAHDSHALAIGLPVAALMHLPIVATRRSISPPGMLWHRPARIMAVSEAVAQVLRKAGVEPAKIVVVPSGIDGRLVATRTAHASDSEPCIVAMGALTREKGHATLLEAFGLLASSIPGSRLLILGNGPELARLTARARRLGLERRVTFAGEQEHPAAALAGAAVFVQPSHREALGTAVLEAMAIGIPVIGSDTGGLSELIGGGAGVLVPPANAALLAAAITTVLRDPDLVASILGIARVRVATYDATAMADRVVEVYRSALGDH